MSTMKNKKRQRLSQVHVAAMMGAEDPYDPDAIFDATLGPVDSIKAPRPARVLDAGSYARGDDEDDDEDDEDDED